MPLLLTSHALALFPKRPNIYTAAAPPLLRLLFPALLLLLLPAAAAAVTAPELSWSEFKTEGSFSYAWTVTKTVDGQAPGETARVRLEKGATRDVAYAITVGRAVDDATVKMFVSGAVKIKNPDAATDSLEVVAVLLQTVSAGGNAPGTPADATPVCALPATLAPGAALQCAFTKAPFLNFPSDGNIAITVRYRAAGSADAPDELKALSAPPYSFASVVGQFATALLTDKVDLSPLDRLYTGFTGFNRDTVWRVATGSTLVPAAGETLTGPTVREYAIRVGDFIVCTPPDGVALANTATVTPQQAGTSGVAKLSTATLSVAIVGCDRPPDVNLQDLASWAAVNFQWALALRPTRQAFNVPQDAGTVPIEYTLAPTATPGTGSYAVSGAVFLNNVQPGLLIIERLVVQLSTGQSAFPVRCVCCVRCCCVVLCALPPPLAMLLHPCCRCLCRASRLLPFAPPRLTPAHPPQLPLNPPQPTDLHAQQRRDRERRQRVGRRQRGRLADDVPGLHRHRARGGAHRRDGLLEPPRAAAVRVGDVPLQRVARRGGARRFGFAAGRKGPGAWGGGGA